MSVERKLFPPCKLTSKNAKNSESHLTQSSKSERALSIQNSANIRRNFKDAGLFKDKASSRETSVAASDNRRLAGIKGAKCGSNKCSYRNGRGPVCHSEVTDRRAAADLGSIFRPGSKKGGEVAGGLLNFSFSPTNFRNQRRPGFSRIQSYEDYGRFHTSNKSHGPCYNKEQFLLANCQFVVKDNRDYAAYLTDPDLLVDWEHVEEVRLLESEPPSCPICLYPPVAAQITRCGHVFCWPCMLHYLSLSDKQWRKCPICYESIYKNQLRSCRAQMPSAILSDKHRITLRLMRRERGSNAVLPASVWSRQRSCRLANLDDEYGRFTKMLSINSSETRMAIISRERNELLLSLEREKGAPECCFILEALDLLEIREASLVDAENEVIVEPKLMATNVKEKPDLNTTVETFEDAFMGICLNSRNKIESSQDCSSIDKTGIGSFDVDSRRDSGRPVDSKIEHLDCLPKKLFRENITEKSYYFYQADNGQPIFMHPLNVHCLIREYGSLQKAPDTVTGLVAQIETFTMNPDIRKHYRYLGHLPSTCVFSLVEIEFDSDQQIISSETISHFADDFAKRRIARDRKTRDEQLQQKRCQRWEKAVMLNSANSRPFSLSDNDAEDIPTSTFVQSAQREIEAALFSPIGPRNIQVEFPGTHSEISVNNAPLSSSVKSNESSQITNDEMDKTPSFAQMLKCGKSKQTRQTSKNTTDIDQPTTSNALEDEYSPIALSDYRSEFGDALQAAFDSLKSHDGSSVNKDNECARSSKKKKKGKILFTL